MTWAIFTAGNEYSNYGKWPSTGVIEGSSAEGAIHCDNCDSDYSIQGNEHINGGRKLKALTSVKKSSKSKAYKLKKGKLQYGTKKVLVTPKKTANNKDRYIRAKNIAPSVKKKALSIAVEELYNGDLKILSEEEIEEKTQVLNQLKEDLSNDKNAYEKYIASNSEDYNE